MVEVTNTIQCKPRKTSGKGVARKLRAEGMAPAAAYGPGTEPRLLALDPHVFMLQRRELGTSHIYDVAIEGEKGFKALIKDIQIDPVSREVTHVDLYAVDMKQPIRVEVPVELDGKPAGVIEGGMLSQVLRSVEVMCLPGDVPSRLKINVEGLGLGEVAHAGSIELPKGVTLTTSPKEAIALVSAPEEEEAAPAGAAPEGAEAAEAAPVAAAE